ncbi:MAG: hypothetical protein ACREFM_15685, partial [Hypericibacter sp.]
MLAEKRAVRNPAARDQSRGWSKAVQGIGIERSARMVSVASMTSGGMGVRAIGAQHSTREPWHGRFRILIGTRLTAVLKKAPDKAIQE